MVVERRKDLGLEKLAYGGRELGGDRAIGRDRVRSRCLLDQVEQLVLHLGREPAEDGELDATLIAP